LKRKKGREEGREKRKEKSEKNKANEERAANRISDISMPSRNSSVP
jgi:hypothetical protein